MPENPIGSTILVIGATGRHGGTGRTVVDGVLARQRNVRVLARADDERTAALRERGATVVIGDLHDRNTLHAAVDGVAAIYLAYPIAAGIVSAAANIASVLVEADQSPHVVVMSMAVSSHQSPSMLGQAQAVAEEVLMWAGLNPTILRIAALFHEDVVILHGRSIRQQSIIANSFGDARAPWIAARDAAELAIHHLLNDAPRTATVSYPPGAEALSHREIAEIISAETGRVVTYQPIPYEQWKHAMERDAVVNGLDVVNSAMAQHISIIGAGFANGKAPTIHPDPQALTTMLGRPPLTFSQFVRERIGDFTDGVKQG
jgi:uncharacterized protein YbjT (DUF2867 family)